MWTWQSVTGIALGTGTRYLGAEGGAGPARANRGYISRRGRFPAVAGTTIGVPPRYLRANYLTSQEALLRETRSTKLYYFPGPVIALILVLLLDDSPLNLLNSAWPPFPYLSSAYGHLPTIDGVGPGTYLLDFFLLPTLIVALWFVVRFLRWATTVYAVTSDRVIVQRGIVARNFDEIPVNQVRGIDVHQSPVERLLGYGTLTISSEAGHTIGNEAWKGIPKPFQFQRLVEGASEFQRSGPNPMVATGNPGTVFLRPPGKA
jgi:hypothetical protein